MPDLQTVRNVELLKVGRWACSNGTFHFTAEDLAAAIEAHKAGVLRKPPLKMGHHDPRFDGGPALGYVDNLRLTDGGTTLVGDFVDVPKAIATLLPRAWPDRSIEGMFEFEAPDGTVHRFVLTSVALLGEVAPAVRTLKSLRDVAAVASGRRVVVAASAFHPADLDAHRRRAVQIAAARRRRTQRTMLGV